MCPILAFKKGPKALLEKGCGRIIIETDSSITANLMQRVIGEEHLDLNYLLNVNIC